MVVNVVCFPPKSSPLLIKRCHVTVIPCFYIFSNPIMHDFSMISAWFQNDFSMISAWFQHDFFTPSWRPPPPRLHPLRPHTRLSGRTSAPHAQSSFLYLEHTHDVNYSVSRSGELSFDEETNLFWWRCRCSRWEKLLQARREALWRALESAAWWWPSRSHSSVCHRDTTHS